MSQQWMKIAALLMIAAIAAEAQAQVGPQHLTMQGPAAAGTTALKFGFPDYSAITEFGIPFSLIPHVITLEHDNVDMFAKATQMEFFVPAGELTNNILVTKDLLTRIFEVRISYSQTSIVMSQSDFGELRQTDAGSDLRFSGNASIVAQLLPNISWTIEELASHETTNGELDAALLHTSAFMIHDLQSVQLPIEAEYDPPLTIGGWDRIGAEGTVPSNATLGGVPLGPIFASIRGVSQLSPTQLTVVPEPTSLTLIGLALACGAAVARGEQFSTRR
jgi:hypothetical protein